MTRGRLIFPFLVDFEQLDTAAIEADPDGAGSLSSGYDEVFREPVKVLENPDDQVGKTVRVENTLQVRAQIESVQFERLEQMISGDSPQGRFMLVLHFRDLEKAGLVDADGLAMIRKGDRLGAIRETDGTLVQNIPDPPGLYVNELLPRGMGLSLKKPKRNLLIVTLKARDQSTRSS